MANKKPLFACRKQGFEKEYVHNFPVSQSLQITIYKLVALLMTTVKKETLHPA